MEREVPEWMDGPAHRGYALTYLLLIVGTLGIGVVVLYLQLRNTRYTLFPTRLEYQRGVLFRVRHVLDFKDLKDMTLSRSFSELVFGLGTLTIISKDKTHPTFRLHGIRRSDFVLDLMSRFKAMTPTQRRNASR